MTESVLDDQIKTRRDEQKRLKNNRARISQPLAEIFLKQAAKETFLQERLVLDKLLEIEAQLGQANNAFAIAKEISCPQHRNIHMYYQGVTQIFLYQTLFFSGRPMRLRSPGTKR